MLREQQDQNNQLINNNSSGSTSYAQLHSNEDISQFSPPTSRRNAHQHDQIPPPSNSTRTREDNGTGLFKGGGMGIKGRGGGRSANQPGVVSSTRTRGGGSTKSSGGYTPSTLSSSSSSSRLHRLTKQRANNPNNPNNPSNPNNLLSDTKEAIINRDKGRKGGLLNDTISNFQINLLPPNTPSYRRWHNGPTTRDQPVYYYIIRVTRATRVIDHPECIIYTCLYIYILMWMWDVWV